MQFCHIKLMYFLLLFVILLYNRTKWKISTRNSKLELFGVYTLIGLYVLGLPVTHLRDKYLNPTYNFFRHIAEKDCRAWVLETNLETSSLTWHISFDSIHHMTLDWLVNNNFEENLIHLEEACQYFGLDLKERRDKKDKKKLIQLF